VTTRVDEPRYAVVGAGASGSLLIGALAQAGARGPVVLVDDDAAPLESRTWAWWASARRPVDELESRTWTRMAVVAPESHLMLGLSSHRYVATRGSALRVATDAALEQLHGSRVIARACDVRQEIDHAVVLTGQGEVRAPWVLDSVGLTHPPVAPAPASLAFLGVEVHTDAAVFDPDVVRLMDFRVPQQEGLSFAYVLPWSAHHALVEVACFAVAPEPAALRHALERYLDEYVGGREVVRQEDGVVPLTRPPSARRTGRLVALGHEAGMVKASTGYAFERISRDSGILARQLADGHLPQGLARPRHRVAMDDVFVDLVRNDPERVRDALIALFARNPLDRVVRFLDETESARDLVDIVASLPALPFARSASRTLVSTGRTRAGAGQDGGRRIHQVGGPPGTSTGMRWVKPRRS
jgi:lycopene beta-cyclase